MSELIPSPQQKNKFMTRKYVGAAFIGAAVGFGAGMTFSHYVDQKWINADHKAIGNDLSCKDTIRDFGNIVDTSSLSTAALKACGYNKPKSDTSKNTGPTSIILSAHIELPSVASLDEDIQDRKSDIEQYNGISSDLSIDTCFAIAGLGAALAVTRGLHTYQQTH